MPDSALSKTSALFFPRKCIISRIDVCKNRHLGYFRMQTKSHHSVRCRLEWVEWVIVVLIDQARIFTSGFIIWCTSYRHDEVIYVRKAIKSRRIIYINIFPSPSLSLLSLIPPLSGFGPRFLRTCQNYVQCNCANSNSKNMKNVTALPHVQWMFFDVLQHQLFILGRWSRHTCLTAFSTEGLLSPNQCSGI